MEIRVRAGVKAYSKISGAKRRKRQLASDLRNGYLGGITREEMHLLIDGEEIEILVWEYIEELVNKDKNE
jgi:hypothetical protein